MGIGGLGTRSNRLQEGIGGFFKGHLGSNGHQHKVDMVKSNKDGEIMQPSKKLSQIKFVWKFEDLKSEKSCPCLQ